MKMPTRFDVIKICGYVTTFGTGLSALLPTVGLFPANDVSRACGIIALTVGLATLIANTLKNPSPPEGAVSANIPKGYVPVVGFPTVAGGQQVAVAGPAVVESNTVRQVTAVATPAPIGKSG